MGMGGKTHDSPIRYRTPPRYHTPRVLADIACAASEAIDRYLRSRPIGCAAHSEPPPDAGKCRPVGKTSNTSGPHNAPEIAKKNFRAPPAENRGPILPQKNFHGAGREGAPHSSKKIAPPKFQKRAEKRRRRRSGRRFSLIGAGNST